MLQFFKDDVKNKKTKRVGRGPSSGHGKTSCRGHNGCGSRAGYKKKYGYEGGQLPLYRRLPCRGFSRAKFRKPLGIINLYQINKFYEDGEIVNEITLIEKGLLDKKNHGFKILGKGKLTKKVQIEAYAISDNAKELLNQFDVPFKINNASIN